MLPSTNRRLDPGLLTALCCLSLACGLLMLPAIQTVWQHASRPAPVVLTERGDGSGGPAASAVPAETHRMAPTDTPDEQATTVLADSVRLTASTDYYTVEGSSLSALLASLRERGPSDGHGTWAANTAWVFRWSYQPVMDAGCRVASARVDLDLTYTYPTWAATENATPALVTAWDGYLAHVELHEHGHREIAEAAATDLVKTLQGLPAQSSCDALAVSARATAGQLLARHAEAQRAYDQETGHGATQGAVLTPDY